MASGTIRYDQNKNIVYCVTGDSHLREEMLEFGQKWDALVKDNDMKDFHCIVDASKLDPTKFIPDYSESDPARKWYGLEQYATRMRGSGRFALVISSTKGNSPVYMDVFNPDAVFDNMEAAEDFVINGILRGA